MGVCRYDLLVVGGGINGAGIARDAAGRGLSVALVERADLASATSSASTKLVHGGLRYLESFEFRLVRESLDERERLLSIAPHLVHPMRFILPHVAGLRPRWQIRLGLFLYDYLGARRRLPPSRAVRLSRTAAGEPLQSRITHGFEYSDCAVDDSRLVVLNALDASERGATIHTRTQFVSAQRADGHWIAECQDQRSGRRFPIRARALVNAAGPWVDRTLRSLPGTRAGARLRLVRGSHIVVHSLYEGDQAYLLQNPDGRVVFTIPYEGSFTLIGTTDVLSDEAPDFPVASTEEVEYLCETVNDYFHRRILPSDSVWTFAGVRPLVDDDAAQASKVTRDYRLELDPQMPPLLSVFGGKLTTYRKLAESVLEKLTPLIGGSRGSWTGRDPLPGGDLPGGDYPAFLADARHRWPFLPAAVAERMARSYGTRLERILGDARGMHELGEQFGAGLTAAEVRYLCDNEWALTAEDILWRRTKIGLRLGEAEGSRLARFLAQENGAASTATTARI